jgi:glycine/D-amino acid oxidase-like deaminating enzyme
MSPDIIVIGGGIGGTALTYALARAGTCLPLERAHQALFRWVAAWQS